MSELNSPQPSETDSNCNYYLWVIRERKCCFILPTDIYKKGKGIFTYTLKESAKYRYHLS